MASISNEVFTRITDSRIRQILEEIALQTHLPIELLFFNCKETAKILGISIRSLRNIIAERKISFIQIKDRSKIRFTAKDILEYAESIKIKKITL